MLQYYINLYTKTVMSNQLIVIKRELCDFKKLHDIFNNMDFLTVRKISRFRALKQFLPNEYNIITTFRARFIMIKHVVE